MVQLHPGSFDGWSVGVSAARVLGKDEDRVQFPGGPSTEQFESNHKTINGALVQRDDAWLAPRKSGFDSPTLHLRAHGPTGRH